MKFFIAKLTYKNGDLAYPWSLFADSALEAHTRLDAHPDREDYSEITIRERPMADARMMGRDPDVRDDAVLEHTEREWWPEA